MIDNSIQAWYNEKYKRYELYHPDGTPIWNVGKIDISDGWPDPITSAKVEFPLLRIVNQKPEKAENAEAEAYAHKMFYMPMVIELFRVLCLYYSSDNFEHGGDSLTAWKSKLYPDGSAIGDYFIAGIIPSDKQICFYIPLAHWDDFSYNVALDKAPNWDGVSSIDILERLKSIK